MKFCGTMCLLLALSAVCSDGLAATLYTNDGTLTARLELERWYINRARYGPENEADRLGLVNTNAGGHPDYDVCEDTTGTNDFGTTTNKWAPWRIHQPPLAPHYILNITASNHARDVMVNGWFEGWNPHQSPSSNYYTLGYWPDERFTAQGYFWSAAGENFADAPFLFGPSTVHDALFTDANVPDRGHRQTIISDWFREIGLGTCTNGISYQCYVQDFGARWGEHFFTDTIFYDANTNKAYNEGEGIGGVEIRLWRGTNEAAYYDASQSSGNFAIPIASLPDGSNITIQLVNTNSSNVTVSIPIGYTNAGNVVLPAFSNVWYGSYTQPTGDVNVGFRQLTLSVAVSNAAMIVGSTNATIRFPSLGNAPYLVQSQDNMRSNNWVTFTNVTASNVQTTVTDTGQGGRGAPGTVSSRFYRVILQKD